MATMAAAAATAAVPEVYARDPMIAWFRSEFAAANAIIDALCGHLARVEGGKEYEAVFAAIHRRRLNWIPVLQMQKYYSIADVFSELRSVEASRAAASLRTVPEEPVRGELAAATPEEEKPSESESGPKEEELSAGAEAVAAGVTVAVAAEESDVAADEAVIDSIPITGIEEETAEDVSSRDSSDHKGAVDGDANGGSQGEEASLEHVNACLEHRDCLARPERINISKGFVAKEAVKGHMVNVVKGLKVYEDIFTEAELINLNRYINELRLAGRRGELTGETFIFFNKQMKGNKREIIQLGVPLFQSTAEEAASNIEPIPPALQSLINHLVQWRLIPESKKPNSCMINFFDEDEHSQPYFKPPHIDNPISTLVLSETIMAFGRSLISDHEGNYKGSLTLTVKEGSLLVMRGNSAEMARHVVCASLCRRMIITFVKVRTPSTQQADSPTALQPGKAMTLWQPGSPAVQQKFPTAGVIAYGPPAMIPATWGLALRSPVVVLSPPSGAVLVSPNKKVPRNGTGVFLPWGVGPKKYTKHLPPRIQKRRLPSLPSPLEASA